MGGRQHVSIVDQRAAAVKLIEVRQPHHPRELVHGRRVTADDLRVHVRRPATYVHRDRIYRKIWHPRATKKCHPTWGEGKLYKRVAFFRLKELKAQIYRF